MLVLMGITVLSHHYEIFSNVQHSDPTPIIVFLSPDVHEGIIIPNTFLNYSKIVYYFLRLPLQIAVLLNKKYFKAESQQ